MADYKDLNEIREAWNNKEYICQMDIPSKVIDNYIFDEELSVKRNREMVKEWNDKVANLQMEKRRKNNELSKKLTEDVIAYLMGEYDFSHRQAELVERYVYNEKHSFMCDYFSAIDDIAEMVAEVLRVDRRDEYGS